jgi:adenylyl-sulfate kinase
VSNRPPPVLWLTGLPAAGKSTIAQTTARLLGERGTDVEILDGDAVRAQHSPELGFSREDRGIQARRLAAMADALSRDGTVAIVAAVTPYRDDRAAAATLLAERFLEVWVACSPTTCAARDPKGLWARAERGEISAFTGVDDPYEAPLAPRVTLDTERRSPSDCATILVDLLDAACCATEPGETRATGDD